MRSNTYLSVVLFGSALAAPVAPRSDPLEGIKAAATLASDTLNINGAQGLAPVKRQDLPTNADLAGTRDVVLNTISPEGWKGVPGPLVKRQDLPTNADLAGTRDVVLNTVSPEGWKGIPGPLKRQELPQLGLPTNPDIAGTRDTVVGTVSQPALKDLPGPLKRQELPVGLPSNEDLTGARDTVVGTVSPGFKGLPGPLKRQGLPIDISSLASSASLPTLPRLTTKRGEDCKEKKPEYAHETPKEEKKPEYAHEAPKEEKLKEEPKEEKPKQDGYDYGYGFDIGKGQGDIYKRQLDGANSFNKGFDQDFGYEKVKNGKPASPPGGFPAGLARRQGRQFGDVEDIDEFAMEDDEEGERGDEAGLFKRQFGEEGDSDEFDVEDDEEGESGDEAGFFKRQFGEEEESEDGPGGEQAEAGFGEVFGGEQAPQATPSAGQQGEAGSGNIFGKIFGKRLENPLDPVASPVASLLNSKAEGLEKTVSQQSGAMEQLGKRLENPLDPAAKPLAGVIGSQAEGLEKTAIQQSSTMEQLTKRLDSPVPALSAAPLKNNPVAALGEGPFQRLQDSAQRISAEQDAKEAKEKEQKAANPKAEKKTLGIIKRDHEDDEAGDSDFIKGDKAENKHKDEKKRPGTVASTWSMPGASDEE